MRIDFDFYSDAILIESNAIWRVRKAYRWIKGKFAKKQEGPRPTLSLDQINEITNQYWNKEFLAKYQATNMYIKFNKILADEIFKDVKA